MHRRLDHAALTDCVIDGHAHLGISPRAYTALEYPYGQSVEDLDYRLRGNGIDAAIVFPLCADLYFDPHAHQHGVCRPGNPPLSPVPYGLENRMLLREVFTIFADLPRRYLPFLSADPGRCIPEQVADLTALADEYPVYGLKIVPVFCQSPVTALLEEGRPLLDFTRERKLPILLHTTADPDESYSTAALAFRVIEANPDLRFCLAHCIGFHRGYLERAAALPNVFVDTAALKIQVQLAEENSRIIAPVAARFPAEYRDHRAVMHALAAAFPDMMIWGSDAPAYTYISRRQQADGYFIDFNLRARYEDEVAALDALPTELRRRVCNENTLCFVFGDRAGRDSTPLSE
jgi:predicted TIM-barrel fold metal-dependent hydrolase